MSDLFSWFDVNLFFSLKLFLVPTILLIIAVVEKKFGTVLGGAFSGLPLISGTLLCFSVFNQTSHDYYLSIYGALEGVISLGIMVFSYSKMTYALTKGEDMKLSAKNRTIIMCKALFVYLVVSAIFSFLQTRLHSIISSNVMSPFAFIAVTVLFNYFLYKNLPKIRPDENKVNFKFKNSLYMALIGTVTFSIFSSIKIYGSNSALIGLVSTAPFYLSMVIIMTHKLGTDYDLLHLNQGIFVGFFGYIVFFSIFLIGLTILQITPQIIVPLAIIATISSSIIYALKFNKTNKMEVTRLSESMMSPMVPLYNESDNHVKTDENQ